MYLWTCVELPTTFDNYPFSCVGASARDRLNVMRIFVSWMEGGWVNKSFTETSNFNLDTIGLQGVYHQTFMHLPTKIDKYPFCCFGASARDTIFIMTTFFSDFDRILTGLYQLIISCCIFRYFRGNLFTCNPCLYPHASLHKVWRKSITINVR